MIDIALVILNTMSEDERIRQEYYQREKWAMDKASQAAYLKEMKEQAVRAQEEAAKAQEKLKQAAIKFRQLGLSVKEIADITGLSIKEIKKLQN